MTRPVRRWTVALVLLTGVRPLAAETVAPIDTQAGTPPPAADALGGIRLPAGVTVSLFAAEPLITNPIAATADAAGRLWVAENRSYAEPGTRYDERFRDRVTVLEDTDDDGRADGARVAVDGVVPLTGLALGAGGVWLMCPPRLLFIPDRLVAPGQDPRAAAAAATAVLDGFTVPEANHHNVANGLAWGPDGWLYGRCGASAPGDVGRPGDAAATRVPLRGGLWRYQPHSGVFEPLVHGTTNPWGHDWDARGECFFVNTVNGHLWHLAAGAHFHRSHTIDPNPHVHELLDQHADHHHFDTGRGWQASRDGAADGHGGGHAHAGAWIVPDEACWPAAWRGRLLTLNFHGRRINAERLDPVGSGFVARHEPDAVSFSDPWFRGIDLVPGGPGRVAVLDWSDTGECHEHDGVHRSSGRIFMLRGAAAPAVEDVTGWPAERLAGAIGGDEWHARAARHELAARHARAEDLTAARGLLAARLAAAAPVPIRLRALWSLWVSGGVPEADLIVLTADGEPAVRAWALRLLSDDWPIDTVLSGRPRADVPPSTAAACVLGRLAADPAAPVRCALASVLQRLPVDRRAALARLLASRAEDATDHDLPLLVWYALIPAVERDPDGVARVWMETTWSGLQRSIVRRLAECSTADGAADAGLGPLVAQASDTDGDAGRRTRLTLAIALGEAFRGRQRLTAPPGWSALHAALGRDGPEPALHGDALALRFGDAAAEGRLVELVRGPRPGVGLDLRPLALAALVDARAAGHEELCRHRLEEPDFTVTAAAGLAAAGHAADAELLCRAAGRAPGDARGPLIAALASRPAWAARLLEEVAAGRVPRDAIDQNAAARIQALGARTRRPPPGRQPGDADTTALEQTIERWRARLPAAELAAADPAAGQAHWNRLCAGCHRLHGRGGTLGPDLTGAGRHDLGYLLQNILAPSMAVAADYRQRQLVLADGRVLVGIVTRRTPTAITLRSPVDEAWIAPADVEVERDLGTSPMPEGLLDGLDPAAVRDLVAFLMAPGGSR